MIETAAAEQGRMVEAFACRHLESAGLTLVTRNFRCRQGEIDLIMREGAVLVFVEVRYRRQSRFGSGAESVNGRKRLRIITAARYFLHQSREPEPPCRFDVVSVAGEPDRYAVEWIRNAFEA